MCVWVGGGGGGGGGLLFKKQKPLAEIAMGIMLIGLINYFIDLSHYEGPLTHEQVRVSDQTDPLSSSTNSTLHDLPKIICKYATTVFSK